MPASESYAGNQDNWGASAAENWSAGAAGTGVETNEWNQGTGVPAATGPW